MFRIEKKVEVWSELGQNPSIGKTAEGNLLILHTDLTDCMAECRLFLQRSIDGGETWAPPEFSIESSLPLGGVEGTLSCIGDLAIIGYMEASDIKRIPDNPKYSYYIRSTDGGRSWSQRKTLHSDTESVAGDPLMPFGKIIRLYSTGELLMPAYSFSTPLEREKFGGQVNILSSTDEGENWILKGVIRRDPDLKGFLIGEPSLLELPDGRLLSIIRGNSIEEGVVPRGFRSVSEDGGATWSVAEPINVSICEPRLILTPDENILLLARSWPGNMIQYYRPLRPEEREPGSKQIQTLAAEFADDYQTPVTEFGLLLFTTADEGRTWEADLTMESPREESEIAYRKRAMEDPQYGHRYQAGYGDIVALNDNRYFVVIRQPDPDMPDLRPGLTYSHAYQRFIGGNIIRKA